MVILTTPEGKTVKVDAETDVQIYSAPHNPPDTGTAYTAGTDLYAHRARSGKVYYYAETWSMWQGTETTYRLLTEEEAREFIIERAGGTDYERAGIYVDRAEKYFPGIFEETA